MSNPTPKADANLDLVKAMGSKKGYDPMPPDQYNYFQNSPDGVQKIIAYMRAHTIALGCRSPYAVAKNGNRPVTKADIARDRFDGDRANACRAWDATEATGLVKCDDKGLLWLCGDVKLPHGKLKKALSVQTALSPYLIEQIEALPKESRVSAYADFARVSAFKKQIETDALNLARLQGDAMENSVCDFYTLRNRRMDKKKRPDLHENGSEWLKLDMRSVPKDLEKFVQTAKSGDCTDSKNGFVQTANGAGILISSEIQREAGERAFSKAVEQPPSKPPARSPIQEKPHWHKSLFAILKALPNVGTGIDNPMLLRIASHLTEELLPQFEVAAKEATGIRKWAGFETVARQVAERGLIPKEKSIYTEVA